MLLQLTVIKCGWESLLSSSKTKSRNRLDRMRAERGHAEVRNEANEEGLTVNCRLDIHLNGSVASVLEGFPPSKPSNRATTARESGCRGTVAETS